MSRIPARGRPCHTRMLEVELLQRDAEHLEVRGNVLDLRKSGLVPLPNELQSAGFVHHMQIGLEIEAATARVERVQVEQPYVAMEASGPTGGECCRDPIDRLGALEGAVLAPGFEKEVTRVFGGPLGCSHLMTLGQTIGRALPRALAAERRLAASREADERIFKRTVFIDGLTHDDGGELELVVQQADLATTPRGRYDAPFGRFGHQHEVEAHAIVALAGMQVRALTCAERVRSQADLGHEAWTRWTPIGDEVQHVVDQPIMPGLGSRLIGALADREERAVALDALLHLGPGFLQCLAALPDGGVLGGTSDSGAVQQVGGNRDSCYMWRTGGALDRPAAAPPRPGSDEP